MLRVGIVERIAHLGYAICTIGDVERCVVLLEVLGEWLSVRGWLRSLGLVWMQFEDVLPFNLNTITIVC
jgi:hypothetical protein